MELAYPAALALLAAVPLAWWLYRRSAAHDQATHPLWFLVPDGERPQATQARRTSASVWLWLAMLAALAIVAAGPTITTSNQRSGLVIDMSLAMQGRGLQTARTSMADAADDAVIVLVLPDSTMTLNRAEASRILDGKLPLSAGAVRPARLSAGAALARRVGATDVQVIAAPAVTADVGIVSARFARAPLAAKRGHIIVELAKRGSGSASVQVIARGRSPLWTRSVTFVSAHHVVEVPYVGVGADLVEIELRVTGRDELVANNRAIVEIPVLSRTQLFIEPDLRSTPAARALRALPSVVVVPSPSDRVVVVSRNPDTKTRGRAVLVVRAASGSTRARLLPVPGAPLPGLTSRLLAEHPAIAANAVDVPASAVWLRAGPFAAIYTGAAAGRDVIHIPAALRGAVLAVALADIFATTPARKSPSCRTVVGGDLGPGHHETRAGCVLVQPGAVLAERASSSTRNTVTVAPAKSFAMIQVLLLLVVLLLVGESIVSRPALYGLATRVGLGLIILAALGVAKTPEYRRVVFVVDVSASAGEVSRTLALVARDAANLASRDRAGVIVVAGGAATVVPLGSPAAVVRWARSKLAIPPGIDRNKTDLQSGFAVASKMLGNTPGAIVLVGDGHDSVRGRSVMDSPDLAGYAFRFVAVSRGDVARISALPVGLRGRVGAALAVPVTIEATRRVVGTLSLYVGGKRLASRAVDVAKGATTITVAATIASSGQHRLRAEFVTTGDQATQNNTRSTFVQIYGRTNTLVLRGDAATLPDDARELSRYDVIVLDDVEYAKLGDVRARHIVDFVRAGGTLMLSGDTAAFAKGGYTGTVLDHISPLRSDPKASGEGAAVVMLLDRSGSVAQATNAPNLPGAGQLAALGSRLGANDLFGVIAFDVAAHPVRVLSPAADTSRSPRLPLPHGGTNPVAALRMAARWLASTGERRKVVVMVTDGGFADAYEQTRRAAIELTAIGARLVVLSIGRVSKPRRRALSSIAAKGNGFVIAGRTLSDAIPALRVGANVGVAPSSTHKAEARAALRNLLSNVAFDLFHQHRVAAYVLTGLVKDATVLVDVDAHPLLALRSEGGGHVFALATNLQPEFTSVVSHIGAFAMRARQSRLPIELAPTDVPGTFRVRVKRRKMAPTAVIVANGTTRPLRYRGVKIYETSLLIDDETSINVDGVGSVRVSATNVEHAPLAIDHLSKKIAVAHASAIAARVSRWPLLLLLIATGLILVLIARNNTETFRA